MGLDTIEPIEPRPAPGRQPNRTRSGKRSAVTSGARILPNAHSQSVWCRVMRDTRDALYSHLGGEDRLSETQRLVVRRVATFETELIFLEDKFAQIRHAGGEPERDDLNLYNTLANGQRRFLEALGWSRVPVDVTPDLTTYLRQVSPSVRSPDIPATPAPDKSEDSPAANVAAPEGMP